MFPGVSSQKRVKLQAEQHFYHNLALRRGKEQDRQEKRTRKREEDQAKKVEQKRMKQNSDQSEEDNKTETSCLVVTLSTTR